MEDPPSTVALNTALEKNFVSPLTAVRGALEVLRDMPDLSASERLRFVEAALKGCAHLEAGIEDLAEAVYAAASVDSDRKAAPVDGEGGDAFSARITVLEELDTIELDFSDFVFTSSAVVNAFFDHILRLLESRGRFWFFLVNCEDCRVWPEAWVAYANKSKEVRVKYSYATLRYDESMSRNPEDTSKASAEEDIFPARDIAIAEIERIRRENG
ncbi:MAG: hypothetical protein RIM33_09365 [Alphaproteobacteria bacterium]